MDGGKYSNLIDSILKLFFREVIEFDFFEGILLMISQSLHLIDRWISALSWFMVIYVPSLASIVKSLMDMWETMNKIDKFKLYYMLGYPMIVMFSD